MNADDVAGDVGLRKEREPHDMVPMHMRHENVDAVFPRRALPRNQAIAEFAHARPEIADHVLVARTRDLDATRVAAEGAPDGERQLALDEGVDRLGTVQRPAACGDEC